MRTLCLTLALGAAVAVPLNGQVPLGGCREGSEIGWVRVERRTPLLEYRDNNTYTMAEIGDEFRACRELRSYVVITLVQRGVGFRIDRSAIEFLGQQTNRPLHIVERGCIARVINSIQSRYRGDEQAKELLRYSRTVRRTLPELMMIRGATLRGGVCIGRFESDVTQQIYNPAPGYVACPSVEELDEYHQLRERLGRQVPLGDAWRQWRRSEQRTADAVFDYLESTQCSILGADNRIIRDEGQGVDANVIKIRGVGSGQSLFTLRNAIPALTGSGR